MEPSILERCSPNCESIVILMKLQILQTDNKDFNEIVTPQTFKKQIEMFPFFKFLQPQKIFNLKILISLLLNMSANVYSRQNHHTVNKSNFSFISGKNQFESTALLRTLKDSKKLDYRYNCFELFPDDQKQNENMKSINQSYSYDYIQQVRNEHRVEVEKLLEEISQLHDLLREQEQIKNHNLQKIKEDAEQCALLRISHLRQSQISQIELYDGQLKKIKQALEQKTQDFNQLQKSSKRKIQNLNQQIDSLQNDLKNIIQSKNQEIFQMIKTHDKKINQNNKKNDEKLNQMKQINEKQLKKIQKKLQQKQQNLLELQNNFKKSDNDNSLIKDKLQEEKVNLKNKMFQIINEQKDKQNKIVNHIKQFYQKENYQQRRENKEQMNLLTEQINQLIKIIEIRDEETQRNIAFRQNEKKQFKLISEALQSENLQLKKKINEIKKQQIEQIQLLKVKMSILHKNDSDEVIRIYEQKIDNLSKNIQKLEEEKQTVVSDLNNQLQKKYRNKKKYDYTISKLHEQILRQRMGISEMQKNMKQKVDHQKSMIMLTSHSFIKDAEEKKNIRVYEEELRKLRQILQIQAREVEDSQRNVEEKIRMAQDELERLTNRILQVKSQSQEAEKKYKKIIDAKQAEIQRLNSIINAPIRANEELNSQCEQIRNLENLLTDKQDKNKILINKCQALESQVRQLKQDIERMEFQNQMNTEQAKKSYKMLSDKNLRDVKAFYQRRIQELQSDKVQLTKINSSQSQNITALIQKYKKMQESMRQLTKTRKKREQLQMKVINLGMDHNLVKNMTELFHK